MPSNRHGDHTRQCEAELRRSRNTDGSVEITLRQMQALRLPYRSLLPLIVEITPGTCRASVPGDGRKVQTRDTGSGTDQEFVHRSRVTSMIGLSGDGYDQHCTLLRETENSMSTSGLLRRAPGRRQQSATSRVDASRTHSDEAYLTPSTQL